MLTHEDIFADAGAKNKVVLKEFVANADAAGHITLTFRGGVPLTTTAGHSAYELTEDYVTALAEDGAGHLLVGHRQTGLEVRDEATGKRVYPGPKDAQAADYLTSLLPQPDGTLLIGGYGDGVKQLSTFGGTYAQVPAVAPSPAPQTAASLPTPAAPPTLAELNAMLKTVQSLSGEMPAGSAVYLGEDWQTQGDWVGRYGRQYAVLCAMNHVLTCTDAYSVDGIIGPNRDPADGMRWWTTAMETDNPKALYTPVTGVRRQSEWDDHGEFYPSSLAGPDLWIKVHLATGDIHRVSLYFVNKDGHDGDNRDRDYLIEVKPYRKTVAQAEAAPVLAHARVHDFWNGVYAQFAVKSPGDYYVKISRNHSHNTIVSAVLIDKLTGEQAATDQEPMAYMNGVHYDPPAADTSAKTSLTVAARSLWKALDAVPANADAQRFRLAAYRALTAAKADPALLADVRWSLLLWMPNDRVGFEKAMAYARQAGAKLAHARTPAEFMSASN